MINEILPKADGVPQTHCLENRVYVCTEEVPRYDEAHPRERPSQYRGRSDTDELGGQVRSNECMP